MAESVNNEVVLQIAAQIMREQNDHIIQQFHHHLLNAQDMFHEGIAERQREYQLAVQLAIPMIPYTLAEQDTAERRFNSLVDRFSMEGETILENFERDTSSIRNELSEMLRKVEDSAKEAERARADELFNVTNVCRREVAATVALVKSESAASGTEIASMNALKQSLEVATKELTQTRNILNDVTKELEEVRASSRVAIDQERQKANDTIAQERDEMAKRIQELVKESEAERTKHLEEVTEMHKRHATALEKMRQQGEDARAELEYVREECDDLRQRESAIQKAHSNEKANMMKIATELEVELQSAKMQALQAHGDFKTKELEMERLSETRKLLEVSSFKRRIAETSPTQQHSAASPTRRVHYSGLAADSPSSPSALGNLAPQATNNNFNASGSYYTGGAGSPNVSRGASLLNSSSVRAASREPMMGARSPSASPLQQAATHYSPYRSHQQSTTAGSSSYVTSPPFRESSVSARETSVAAASPRSVSLRSPSETYLKLQSLSSTWRDKLASGSTY